MKAAAAFIILAGTTFMAQSARSQTASSAAGLDGAEMEMVQKIARLVVDCRKDPRQPRCAAILDLLGPPRPAAGEAPLSIEKAARSAKVGGGVDQQFDSRVPGRALRFADGHAQALGGQGVPPRAGADVTLAADSNTKTASITLNIDRTRRNQGNPSTLAIKAEAPIGQGSDYTNLATQDGMTKATSVGLAFSHLIVKQTDRSLIINGAAYQDDCSRLVGRFKSLSPETKIDPPFAPGGCSADLVTSVVLSAHLPEIQAKPLLDALEELRRRADPPIDSVWMFTGNAKVGYEKHTFHDPLTLEKDEVDRTPFEVGLAATRVFHGGNMSGTLSYKFQRVYKDGGTDEETQTLCQPVGTPFLPCVSGFIGHPLRAKQHLFSADYRYISDVFGIPSA
ncbi:MAG: hypothetical protein ACREE0_01435 [Phenylobacterium sp.]